MPENDWSQAPEGFCAFNVKPREEGASATDGNL